MYGQLTVGEADVDVEVLAPLVGEDPHVHPVAALEDVEAVGAEGAPPPPIVHLVVDVTHPPVIGEDPHPVLLVHGRVVAVDLRLARALLL